jgi:hypothetical protein
MGFIGDEVGADDGPVGAAWPSFGLSLPSSAPSPASGAREGRGPEGGGGTQGGVIGPPDGEPLLELDVPITASR